MNFVRLIPAAFVLTFAGAAAAPDWTQVPAKTIRLFQPGQTSLEWMMTPGEHKGADRFRNGAACLSCHTGQEKQMGTMNLKSHESVPLAGKPASIDAKVQFARDAQDLYVRIEFSNAGQPSDKPILKVAMMLDGGATPEAARAGCWAMCHDDSADMPSARGSARTMYLSKTRAKVTRQGGGDVLKPAGELARLKAGGYGLEYWEATLSPAGKVTASNGLIFDRRLETKTVVKADAARKGAVWTVVLSRKLNAGNVAFVPGKKYAVGFAIAAGEAKRFHYVSFERSLSVGPGIADFIAK